MPDLSLARFLPNGQLDTTTFGAVGSAKAGTTFIPFNISGQNYDFGVRMIAQPNNMITFGAYTSLNNAPPAYFGAAQFIVNP